MNNTINTSLDSLLIEGIELQRKLISENSNPISGFINVRKNIISARRWVLKVSKFLKNNYPEPESYGYFIKQPKEEKTFPYLVWPSSVLIPDLSSYIESLEEIIRRIDEKENKALRSDLAHDNSVLYRITYSEATRIIMFNNAKLAHPNSDSKAINFFEYVYKNNNKKVKITDIEEATALNLSSNINDILRDLRFVGSFRTVFFPTANKNNVLFRNPISKKEAIANDLPLINLHDLTRNTEK